uniref:(northern house mosquito) hypothetical protein n=1 Tax=Culex pipiens TaxID=7175 RepID=A0A8D8CYI7_CULPI
MSPTTRLRLFKQFSLPDFVNWPWPTTVSVCGVVAAPQCGQKSQELAVQLPEVGVPAGGTTPRTPDSLCICLFLAAYRNFLTSSASLKAAAAAGSSGVVVVRSSYSESGVPRLLIPAYIESFWKLPCCCVNLADPGTGERSLAVPPLLRPL